MRRPSAYEHGLALARLLRTSAAGREPMGAHGGTPVACRKKGASSRAARERDGRDPGDPR